MYAALRALPIPDDVVTRFFHAGALLREHRGDGHIAALMTEGVGGLEAHVLYSLDRGIPAEQFGRIHHLPAEQIRGILDGLKGRALIGSDGQLTAKGRELRARVEARTDELAAGPYKEEISLEPLTKLLVAAQDF